MKVEDVETRLRFRPARPVVLGRALAIAVLLHFLPSLLGGPSFRSPGPHGSVWGYPGVDGFRARAVVVRPIYFTGRTAETRIRGTALSPARCGWPPTVRAKRRLEGAGREETDAGGKGDTANGKCRTDGGQVQPRWKVLWEWCFLYRKKSLVGVGGTSISDLPKDMESPANSRAPMPGTNVRTAASSLDYLFLAVWLFQPSSCFPRPGCRTRCPAPANEMLKSRAEPVSEPI